MTISMLTTVDNPYDPREQWDEWYAYDIACGYHTCAYLARVAHTSDESSEALQAHEIDQAIAEICYHNPLYKRLQYQIPDE